MWPFNRRRRGDDRHECLRFAVGDLAACVEPRFLAPCRHDPRKGDILRVTNVTDEVGVGGIRSIFLQFAGKPTNHAWSAAAFRKIVSDHTPAEEEFKALIKRPARLPEVVR